MKYMYDSFEDYVNYAPFDDSHPMYEAFEMVWQMARSPSFEETQNRGEKKHLQDFTKILDPEVRAGDRLTDRTVNLFDAAERIAEYWNKNAR